MGEPSRRELEDAITILWFELDADAVRLIREELPRLADYCVHLHHQILHEQAMTRRNAWADDL